MKAIILAAGRGERLRPLTDHCPKPLLEVQGKPLIVWHILNLVRAGITELIINHAWLGSMIEQTLGNGARFGAKIRYSPEKIALETAGGIANALPLLGDRLPFIVVNADIYCPQFDFRQVKEILQDNDIWGQPHSEETRDLGWLYLVENPPHHPEGDFYLNTFSLQNDPPYEGAPCYTFSGIAVYRPDIFDAIMSSSYAKLAPLLREKASRHQLGGEIFRGNWTDVGTPERLLQLNSPLKEK